MVNWYYVSFVPSGFVTGKSPLPRSKYEYHGSQLGSKQSNHPCLKKRTKEGRKEGRGEQLVSKIRLGGREWKKGGEGLPNADADGATDGSNYPHNHGPLRERVREGGRGIYLAYAGYLRNRSSLDPR